MKYWWYALELKIFKNINSFLRPVKMTILDQTTTPFILNSTFLYYLAFTDGKSHQQAIELIRNKCLPLILDSYKVWPLFMLVTFYLIPLQHR